MISAKKICDEGNESMNCLILGGLGFLGSHLAERLCKEGHSVLIYDRFGSSQRNIASFATKVKIIEGDFGTEEDFAGILRENHVDVVFHLVSTTHPASSDADKVKDICGNVLPTLRLLEACRSVMVKKIVFFSSGGTIYGIPQSTPLKEVHPTNPICSYGIHKLTIEKYLELFSHQFDLDYLVMRIANPYGPRQVPFSGQGVIAAFAAKALAGEALEVWGDGSVVRDYIYVDDVMDFVINTFDKNSTGQRIFNVGSGRGYSLKEIVAALENVMGKPLQVTYGAKRIEDVPVNVLDCSLAFDSFAWRAATSLEKGLQALISTLINAKTG